MQHLRQNTSLAESAIRDSIVRLDSWDDVSCFGFPVGASGSACPELLSAEERDRSNRIGHTTTRKRFLAARSALRVLLADMLGLCPQEVQIHISPAGKPFLPGHPVHFSLSHSGDWGAVAISTSREIGIDIEAPREFRRPAALDQRLPSVPGFSLLERWTLAESALKSFGLGIHALGGLIVANQSTTDALFAHNEMRSLARPLRFPVCPSYSAAVAVRSTGERVAPPQSGKSSHVRIR